MTAAIGAEVLRVLLRVTGDATCDPDALRAQLRRLVAGTGVEAELVAEWDRIRGGWLYDVFLCGDEGPGFIVGARPVTPWPFVGARRWTEKDLVKVDHAVMEVSDAVSSLESMWTDFAAMKAIVDACLLRAELRRRDLAVTPDELRAGVEAFRVARGASSIDVWLADCGLPRARFEAWIAERLATDKLVDELVGTAAVSTFEASPAAWDVATVSRLVLAAQHAERVAAELATGADFAVAAARENLAPSLERWFRCDVAEPLRAQIFAGDAIVGPVVDGTTASLYRVWSVEPARLDAATRARVIQHELDRWLAVRRREARISWNWGETAQTDAITQRLRTGE